MTFVPRTNMALAYTARRATWPPASAVHGRPCGTAAFLPPCQDVPSSRSRSVTSRHIVIGSNNFRSPNTHGRRSHLVRPCFAGKNPGSVWRSNSDVPHRSGARTCSGRWPRSASASSCGRSAARPVRPGPGTTWRPARSSRASGGPPGSGGAAAKGRAPVPSRGTGRRPRPGGVAAALPVALGWLLLA